MVGHHVNGLTDAHPQRDLRLEALLAYMRRNCSEPDLSPSAAAAHLRVSVRAVHKPYLESSTRQDETVEVMMEIAFCSATEVEPRRRFEYWNDLVAKAVCGVNIARPSGHDFGATISTRPLHDAASPRFILRRTRSTARRRTYPARETCGFNDLSHFNNVFRSRLGTTPSDLRRRATQARIRPV